MRIGGFALLGVGVIAGVIGLATLATGGNGGPSVAAPTSAEASGSAAAEPPAAAAPSPTGEVPLPSFAATPTAGIAAPPSTSPPPAAGSGDPAGSAAPGGGIAAPRGGGAPVVRVPLRVYNNSTITGLAARAAEDFRSSGWAVESVANYPSGIIPTSTVYYRPGTNELAAAQSLGNQFSMRVEPRFEGLGDASPGLIVIVTNDYQRR
ncbi:LytR C-terminal domain-containing protein [Pseudonocardia bannensis]|uniref:LytR C-terminal domain-containing protein n=1 Tax=Pseudonocardia bannensis TaxID=630973 RepID=A0A848DRM7_9PSEU|nr:LytR C-terminal domain-containing protein [Pseudonocardia bannensis]